MPPTLADYAMTLKPHSYPSISAPAQEKFGLP